MVFIFYLPRFCDFLSSCFSIERLWTTPVMVSVVPLHVLEIRLAWVVQMNPTLCLMYHIWNEFLLFLDLWPCLYGIFLVMEALLLLPSSVVKTSCVLSDTEESHSFQLFRLKTLFAFHLARLQSGFLALNILAGARTFINLPCQMPSVHPPLTPRFLSHHVCH